MSTGTIDSLVPENSFSLLGGAYEPAVSGGLPAPADDMAAGTMSSMDQLTFAAAKAKSITAQYSSATGTLSVLGQGADDTIVVSRNAAGTILVNGGAVVVKGGTPTVANTSLIQISGQGGDDTITLDETNGALSRANIFGGAGRDTITGGSGSDFLFGQAGDDRLFGRGGADFLFGGDGNDILVGGDGSDQMFGEAGDDRMIWNPGDDSDLLEGGDGIDTAEVNGGNGAEVFSVTANGTRVRFDRLDPAPFTLDIGTTENLVVNMNGGDDTFSATGNLAALISITVDGGTGSDTIFGGNGNDVLIGGDGNDFVDGQQGSDTVLLGDGNDLFRWDPGDGNDVVDGGSGTDEVQFNASNTNESISLSANGARALLTRNVGNVTMDIGGIETITISALGGADTVTVNDLAGTGIGQVNVNLAGVLGGVAGDAAADTVIANATNGTDTIDVVGSGTSIAVLGLAATITVSNAEGANDNLVINGLDGDDTIRATTLPAGVMRVTLDGGAGDDTLLGSQGADVLLGGAGDDFVFGDNGNDVALMGAGDDVFEWNPGDGSDTVEGQDGTDELRFQGSNANENISVVANGPRALVARDVANVTMDLDGVEHVRITTSGGTDNVVVGDLTGTTVDVVHLDLGTDGQADSVIVNGANSGDAIVVATGVDGVTTVSGLAAEVVVVDADPGSADRLTINALGGDDTIDASALEADRFAFTINGGLGIDAITGSAGDDVIIGGDGNDLAFMGEGDDTFVWNPGDDNDTVDGQDGFDRLLFNGANVSENIAISANGGHVAFTRDVANVAMDVDGVESIDFNALGGSDTIVINDLSGTDVAVVNLNLAATGGAGDGQVDTVIVNCTNADDVVIVVGDGSALSVIGLDYQINITGFEAQDRLIFNALDGDDVIDATGFAGGMALVLSGDDGNDVLLGSDGNDVLLGGAGDDVLIGGPGLDILDGGLGNDIEIQ